MADSLVKLDIPIFQSYTRVESVFANEEVVSIGFIFPGLLLAGTAFEVTLLGRKYINFSYNMAFTEQGYKIEMVLLPLKFFELVGNSADTEELAKALGLDLVGEALDLYGIHNITVSDTMRLIRSYLVRENKPTVVMLGAENLYSVDVATADVVNLKIDGEVYGEIYTFVEYIDLTYRKKYFSGIFVGSEVYPTERADIEVDAENRYLRYGVLDTNSEKYPLFKKVLRVNSAVDLDVFKRYQIEITVDGYKDLSDMYFLYKKESILSGDRISFIYSFGIGW
jgi:hypothetical protein